MRPARPGWDSPRAAGGATCPALLFAALALLLLLGPAEGSDRWFPRESLCRPPPAGASASQTFGADSAVNEEERLSGGGGTIRLFEGASGDGSHCRVQVRTPEAPPHAGVLAEPHKPARFVLSLVCPSGGRRRWLDAAPGVAEAGGRGPVRRPAEAITFRTRGPGGAEAFGDVAYFTFREPGEGFLEISWCPTAEVKYTPGKHWCNAPGGPKKQRVAVAVTYVRREVRALPEEERRSFFNAIHIMAHTSTQEGRRKFGPKFENYQEIVARHSAAVMNLPCDLGHWGPSLLTYHRAYVRLFENSLQAIDPRLAVPYWDMFVEGDVYTSGGDPSKSILFSEDFYGSFSGDPADGWRVKDGAFAYWGVPDGEEALRLSRLSWAGLGPSNTVSPYGLARRRDNMNRVAHLTRIDKIGDNKVPMATREGWHKCRRYSLLGQYRICLDLAGGVHSAPHMAIGGVSGLLTFAELEGRLNCSGLRREQCLYAFKLAQVLGHSARGTALGDGCLRCPPPCARPDQDPLDCACQCQLQEERCSPPKLLRRTMGKMGIDPASLAAVVPDAGELLVERMYEFAHYLVCTLDMRHGDYFDPATAANDPFFWAHHTNFDRLLGSWRLAHPGATWQRANFTFPSADPAVYPDFLSTNATLPGAGGPYPGVMGPGDFNPSGVCRGHGLWDPLAAGSFDGVFRSAPGDRPHTNLDVLRTLDAELGADVAAADYIYDAYEL